MSNENQALDALETMPKADHTNEEDLPVFKCDCGWTGTEMEMVPVTTQEGIWGKCPDCGNVSDDMEEET